MKAFADGQLACQYNLSPDDLVKMIAGARCSIPLPADAEVFQTGVETTASGQRLFYVLVHSAAHRPLCAGDDIPVVTLTLSEEP